MTGDEDDAAAVTASSTTTSMEAATEGVENMSMNPHQESGFKDHNNDDEATAQKSALQENLERKGKNAYYFAHAHKATGPAWDGKAEPKLLSSRSMSSDEQKEQWSKRSTSFDMSKSNITTYAFCDEGSKVKLYINLDNVGEKCSDDDISLDYTESSFCLIIRNYKNDNDATTPASSNAGANQCLSFGRLTANITKASYKLKQDRIILTLTKEREGEWHTINDKGSPDHELV